MLDNACQHIRKTAEIPSFSTYEERLHPYIRSVFDDIASAREIEVPGRSLLFRLGNQPSVALAAHLDKINHYGREYPDKLPVESTDDYIEGAMDDCAGLGMMLALAQNYKPGSWPDMMFFFSEMEESKGLKEHAELLRDNGKGYQHGMGARRIADRCVELNLVPSSIVTLDTTPLFKGEPGIALYSKHWELNDLDPSPALIEQTEKTVAEFIAIDPKIKLDNNTNDFLEYGETFNTQVEQPVVSVALEPAINPYHQKGERVFVKDIDRCLSIVSAYLQQQIS
jgi:hypothetical protein